MHGPLQLDVVNRLALPYVPAGQELHDADPDDEYVPGPHGCAHAAVEPAGHAQPALQTPLHVLSD